jgi:hypothetical protein
MSEVNRLDQGWEYSHLRLKIALLFFYGALALISFFFAQLSGVYVEIPALIYVSDWLFLYINSE